MAAATQAKIRYDELVPPDASGQYHSAMLPGLWLQVDWLWEMPLPPLLSILKAWDLI